jgi:hypothetical protein
LYTQIEDRAVGLAADRSAVEEKLSATARKAGIQRVSGGLARSSGMLDAVSSEPITL